MGRTNKFVEKIFRQPNGVEKKMEVELFTWEKTDMVDKLKTTKIKGA